MIFMLEYDNPFYNKEEKEEYIKKSKLDLLLKDSKSNKSFNKNNMNYGIYYKRKKKVKK